MQDHQIPHKSNKPILLRMPAVISRVGLSKSSIYNGIKDKTFPAPLRLSRRAVCWNSADIDAWIAERIKGGQK